MHAVHGRICIAGARSDAALVRLFTGDPRRSGTGLSLRAGGTDLARISRRTNKITIRNTAPHTSHVPRRRPVRHRCGSQNSAYMGSSTHTQIRHCWRSHPPSAITVRSSPHTSSIHHLISHPSSHTHRLTSSCLAHSLLSPLPSIRIHQIASAHLSAPFTSPYTSPHTSPHTSARPPPHGRKELKPLDTAGCGMLGADTAAPKPPVTIGGA